MHRPDIYAYLRDHFLFRSIADEDLEKAARLFEPVTLKDGEILYHADYPARNFFLLVKGRVRLIDQDDSLQDLIESGDYFGGQALLSDRNRRRTAVAAGETTLLAINKHRFLTLVSAFPEIKKKLKAVRRSAELADLNSFPWIGEKEEICFIDRKHPLTFLTRLVLPTLGALLIGAGALYISFYPLPVLISIGLLLALWILWTWIDWGNDFYVVTEDRVAWVEKVVWLHDQRKELPLGSILSANLSTNQLQRWIGYGDVVVRTYTGDLTMRNARHPVVLLDLIREAQQRAEDRYQKLEADQINHTIRTRLGLEETDAAPSPAGTEEEPVRPPAGPHTAETVTSLQRFLNLFRARYELNGVITYRKHKFILLKNAWWAVLLAGGLVVLFFARLVNLVDWPSLPWIAVLLALDGIILGYVFVDWANDRFQITDKHIIDLDRKPLGRETKRSALLENVLSLDYERKNITQRLFDFGTVAINVGDIQLDFENVARPQQVQREIFDHFNAAVKQRELAEAERRREDMVEFLAAYHQESSPQTGGPDSDQVNPEDTTQFRE
jgi:hypothetical protein